MVRVASTQPAMLPPTDSSAPAPKTPKAPRSRAEENKFFRSKYGIDPNKKGEVHPTMGQQPWNKLDMGSRYFCAFCYKEAKVWRGKDPLFVCRRCDNFNGSSKKCRYALVDTDSLVYIYIEHVPQFINAEPKARSPHSVVASVTPVPVNGRSSATPMMDAVSIPIFEHPAPTPVPSEGTDDAEEQQIVHLTLPTAKKAPGAAAAGEGSTGGQRRRQAKTPGRAVVQEQPSPPADEQVVQDAAEDVGMPPIPEAFTPRVCTLPPLGRQQGEQQPGKLLQSAAAQQMKDTFRRAQQKEQRERTAALQACEIALDSPLAYVSPTARVPNEASPHSNATAMARLTVASTGGPEPMALDVKSLACQETISDLLPTAVAGAGAASSEFLFDFPGGSSPDSDPYQFGGSEDVEDEDSLPLSSSASLAWGAISAVDGGSAVPGGANWWSQWC